ncbi:hypothetical protein PRECH8_26220 [Insulibacter thermoxylanivorax]|uniref:Tetratricopeptide repeat-containing protein n=1 Tax=Insulibacter thermoxylanivorax TaxID=2749268 RepID=A0A916QEK1_9BACL|nr:DUF2225 domain-containing protein [Insulibacter thermoxylanivorax]GFR39326.1 hypothetical protein PRECH8_26220 [Insulibacter thermoxylanivorax]
MVDPLYQVNYTCLQCGKEYVSSKVRPSFRRPYKRDADLCHHYREINPEYYVVRVCKHCGFAATENFTMRISESQRVRFMERIGRQWQGYDYGYERTWEEALKTYKLALLCAQIKEESSRVIASILHHIAWMYRYQGDAEKEKRFLQHALDAYITVYESGEEELNAARLMYIIGELNRRLKNYNEAIRWFSRVINDKRIMDANMIRACREQWAVVKEEMEEEKRAKQSASSRL